MGHECPVYCPVDCGKDMTSCPGGGDGNPDFCMPMDLECKLNDYKI